MGENSIIRTPKEDSMLGFKENKKHYENNQNAPNLTIDRKIVQFAIKVHQICNSIPFVLDGKYEIPIIIISIDEEMMK